MAVEVRMAKLSPTMDMGTINKWVKKEGDKVSSGDTLAEVETDKASMPLETFEDGVLLKILVPEGKGAKVDELVAVIGKAGEDISAILAGGGAPKKAAAPAAAAAGAAAPAKAGGAPAAAPVAAAVAVATGRVRVSPLAKKIAKERGVNLAAIAATGPGGRIIARDVVNAPAGGANGAAAAPAAGAGLAAPVLPGPAQAGDTDLPLSGIRQTIARRLLQSKQTIPHFYLHSEVNVDRLVQWREEINGALKEGQPKISFNDLVIKITAVALSKHPDINAAFNQTSIRRFGSINIAVAIATDDALYTPVLRNVDKLSLGSISTQVREFAGKAKEKKLRVEELTGSGFTISNLGMFGIDHFFAIINPPEAAILAVGAIKDVPVVRNNAVVPGKVMGLSLSCDHRVIDGAVGAKFMQTLKDLLEHPAKLLL